MNSILPIPRCQISIRPATLADVPFMDSLQKKYGKALGYFPTKQFEEYVQTGGVLVAEEAEEDRLGLGLGAGLGENPNLNPHLNLNRLPLGYIISRDRYLKRDELGVIYQLCVAPGTQRKLVGAALVREVFERSAYGCKLYCCWCAQDLEANYFWESLGFLPVAFRAGSRGKKRVHIFWQRRICTEDVTTPYWYPFQTNAGAIKEDRLVFPIPPGVHWKEVQAVSLPIEGNPKSEVRNPKQNRQIQRPARGCRESKTRNIQGPPPGKVAILVGGRIRYIDRPGYVPPEATREMAVLPASTTALTLASSPAAIPALPALPALPAPKQLRPKRPTPKIDPKYLAAARELRDRYLEKFNAAPVSPTAGQLAGKYSVSKALPQPTKPAFGYNPKTVPVAA